MAQPIPPVSSTTPALGNGPRSLRPNPVRQLLGLAGLILASLLAPPALAAPSILDSVKQNPALARSLCDQFKQLNAAGQSATSKEAVARVAASQGLSALDAEVLSTYVIGLHCPDVR
jgi:hypothetical protein